jgi:hypothetical protein
MGLPSLDIEFSNGNWVAPMMGVDRFDNEHPFMVWMRELKAHPIGEAADTVMASWFAREGARYLLRGDTGNNDEIITQDDVGVDRVEIGSY